MDLTDYQAKYIAHELTRRCASDSLERFPAVLSDAQVDLNPHQIGAALFAFRNRPVPNVRAYLRNETELARPTLVRVLEESGRLSEFFVDPQRHNIKQFVRLPGWFEIDMPVGKYNPDGAIRKHDGYARYLVRETKGTKDLLKLRTTAVDKARCGEKQFETLGVPFPVAVAAEEA